MQLAPSRRSESAAVLMTVTLSLLFARCQAWLAVSGWKKQSPRGSREGGIATETSMGTSEGDI